MIIGITLDTLCVSHIGKTYYGQEAMYVVEGYGDDNDIRHAEYLRASCVLKKKS